MADRAQASTTTAAGVEALIARLREDGVGAGRAEADRILAEAQTRARTIVETAEAEAKAKLAAARSEIDNHRRAGEEALAMAARDTVLDLKDQLARRFATDVGKTVSDIMRDDDMLRRMILEIVGRARAEASADDAGPAEVILPRSVAGLDDLRRKPEELREGTLTHFVAASAATMLREGVTFARAEDDAEGIRVALGDRGVSVDLSDRAVTQAILAHLQPRFRALMEGVVK